MEEKPQLEQWKCTSTCKLEETVARNCGVFVTLFEFSNLADPRNSSRISEGKTHLRQTKAKETEKY